MRNSPSHSPVSIELASPVARVPIRGTAGSAGYDLFACENVCIAAGERRLVDVGIRLAFPSDVYVRIAPRSGLSVRHCIDVGAGVVDSDYRGVLKVLLINNGAEVFEVKVGDRIAQMIFEQLRHFSFSVVDDIGVSDRGSGGFGSTGRGVVL